MRKTSNQFGSGAEAIIYATLLVGVMWLVYWADHLFPLTYFYKYGIQPQELNSLKGILFMPLIHSKNGFEHILNNSVPIFVLLTALIYYYQKIALKVFVFAWIGTGVGLWLFAANSNSFHIGMSGIIYALAGFLFVSGVLRKYLPLQAISLFVAFIYGSMIWGIFPTEAHVSWEGHLSGLVVGSILAIIYRKQGPQSPKYRYEIEQELGIEPPDLEGIWREKVALAKRMEEARIAAQEEKNNPSKDADVPPKIHVVYKYVPKEKPQDGNDGQ